MVYRIDVLIKIIRAFSGAIKQNPHTKNLKEEDLDSHLSLYLTPEQSETRVIMLGFCLSLILLAACSILTSMGIYQRLQDDDQKFTIQNKHTESKTYTILVITLHTYVGTIIHKLKTSLYPFVSSWIPHVSNQCCNSEL